MVTKEGRLYLVKINKYNKRVGKEKTHRLDKGCHIMILFKDM